MPRKKAENSTFDETAYKREYGKENYERVTIYLQKGERDIIKKYAKLRKTTVNALIINLIYQDIEQYCEKNKIDPETFFAREDEEIERAISPEQAEDINIAIKNGLGVLFVDDDTSGNIIIRYPKYEEAKVEKILKGINK